MAIEFIKAQPQTNIYTASERLYLTADRSRVVKDGDPDAAFLLVCAGGQLPIAEARKYGLLDEPSAEAKAIDGPPENKAILFPPENKKQGRRFKKADN